MHIYIYVHITRMLTKWLLLHALLESQLQRLFRTDWFHFRVSVLMERFLTTRSVISFRLGPSINHSSPEVLSLFAWECYPFKAIPQLISFRLGPSIAVSLDHSSPVELEINDKARLVQSARLFMLQLNNQNQFIIRLRSWAGNVRIYVDIYVYVYICIYVYIYICIYIYTCIYTFICMY